MNNLDNFYNSSSYDDDTGVLTLTAPNGNSSSINIYKDIDMSNDDILNKPVIDTFNNLGNKNIVDGSFALSEDMNTIMYRKNGLLDTIYKNRDIKGFTIKYWDNTIEYNNNSIVSYTDGRFFKSSVALKTTAGSEPTTINNTYDLTGSGDVIDLGLVNVNGIYIIDDLYYITTNSGVFKSEGSLESVEIITTSNSTSKYMDIYGNQLIVDGNNIKAYNNTYAKVEYTYSFAGKIISSYFSSNNLLFVMFDGDDYLYEYEFMNNEYKNKYQVNLPAEMIGSKLNCSYSTGRLFFTSIEYDGIYVYDTSTKTSQVVPVSVGTIVSSSVKGNRLFLLDANNIIHAYTIMSSEWIEITSDDIFTNNKCQENYDVIKIYEDIVNDNKDKITLSGMIENKSVAIYTNKYMFMSEHSFRGRISRHDISSGLNSIDVGNYRLLDIYPLFNGYIVGTAIFNGKLIVALGGEDNILIEIDIETMSIIRSSTIKNKINGSSIYSMNAMGDTIYILTSSNKIYKFSDIDSEPVGTVHLSIVVGDSSICVLDSARIWVSTDNGIREFNLDNGNATSLIKIDTNCKVSMSISNGGMYMLGSCSDYTRNSITLYRGTYIRKYKWSY